MSEEIAEPVYVAFTFGFGPDVTFDGLGTSLQPDEPLLYRAELTEDILATDDLDELTSVVRAEAEGCLEVLIKYMQSPRYQDVFYRQLINIVATYRGTMLGKGVPNRETRRANGERGTK